MGKVKVSISVPQQLLKRIDLIAESRGDSRSYVISKVLESGIESQEQFLADMENPVIRGLARVIASSPNALTMLNTIGEEVTAEEFARFCAGAPEQIERGKSRAKGKRSGARR